MFPQLRQRFGSALDLMVEFSTLGEYRLDADGVLCPASALTHAPERVPQLGGAGDSVAAQAAVRRIVAGGAVGLTPAATPAARRAAPPAESTPASMRAATSGAPTPASRRPVTSGGPTPASRRAVTPPAAAPRRAASSAPAAKRPARVRPHVTGEQLCLAV